MRKSLLLLVIAVSFSFYLHADIYIKSKAEAVNAIGKAAKNGFTETWLTEQKSAVISLESTIIIDLPGQVAQIANHATRTYIQSYLPLKEDQLMPPEMAKMMKSMVEDMRVMIQPNGQTKNIMNLKARGYDVYLRMSGMLVKIVVWASTQVPFDWKKYRDINLQMTQAKLKLSEKLMKEFNKIDGFHLGIEMNMMGLRITSTVQEINPTRIAPPGTYLVPEGYVKKDSLSMKQVVIK